MRRLQNKVAIITGGNSGIGKGIAKHFLEEGSKVVIFGRNKQSLDQTRDELGHDLLVVQGHALERLNKHASIILIASCSATITLKRHSIYASTKAAIIKLAKSLAYDLADQSIRVNSISPGYVKTPIFDERLKNDPKYLTHREANTPLKRIGTPQDIANTALFLASDEASYITGIDLLVDGGYSASFPE